MCLTKRTCRDTAEDTDLTEEDLWFGWALGGTRCGWASGKEDELKERGSGAQPALSMRASLLRVTWGRSEGKQQLSVQLLTFGCSSGPAGH